MWFSVVRISASTARLIGPADGRSFSLTAICEVSIVQYSVSVKVVGVVLDDDRVRVLLGWLVGGVRATSA